MAKSKLMEELRREHEEEWAKLTPEERQAKEQEVIDFGKKYGPAIVEALRIKRGLNKK